VEGEFDVILIAERILASEDVSEAGPALAKNISISACRPACGGGGFWELVMADDCPHEVSIPWQEVTLLNKYIFARKY
jgi:hypothetical protein